MAQTLPNKHFKGYGKGREVSSSSAYISNALTGGSGPSEGIHEVAIDRPNQKINTAVALDNVRLALDIESSILDEGGIKGGVDNLKHSLTGTSAVNEEVGAVGPLKHVILPDH